MPEAALRASVAHNGAPHVIPRRSVVSWVLYDLANTVFSMGVISLCPCGEADNGQRPRSGG